MFSSGVASNGIGWVKRGGFSGVWCPVFRIDNLLRLASRCLVESSSWVPPFAGPVYYLTTLTPTFRMILVGDGARFWPRAVSFFAFGAGFRLLPLADEHVRLLLLRDLTLFLYRIDGMRHGPNTRRRRTGKIWDWDMDALIFRDVTSVRWRKGEGREEVRVVEGHLRPSSIRAYFRCAKSRDRVSI